MRADLYLSENKYFDSRNKAKEAIVRGEVFVDGKLIDKVSLSIDENISHVIEIITKKSFVSLGGYKLDKAIEDFSICVDGFVVADIGASTGGFTDCLIKRNAKKVYAVDLNDELLHEKLKNNDCVKRIIKNARLLEKSDFGDKLDLITADLSFISATMVMPVFAKLLDDKKSLLVLIKPQFEVDKKKKFKNGIIKDKKIQKSAIEKIYNCGIENDLIPAKITTAPINEDKNIEFLMLLIKNGESKLDLSNFSY